MYRKVLPQIEEWINNDEKHALLITGARQIGKTYLIREALQKQKKDYVELNFVENSFLYTLNTPKN